MKLADASKPILVGSMLWLSSCAADGTDRADRGLPTFRYRDVEGCGDLLVHAASSDRKEYLVVHASRKRLELSATETWFDLAAPPDGLTVQVDVYAHPPDDDPYCTDFVDAGELPLETWKPTRGKLRISLTGFKAPAEGMPQETYWAHVRLEFAEFQDQHGSLVWHDAPIDLDAEVGWMLG